MGRQLEVSPVKEREPFDRGICFRSCEDHEEACTIDLLVYRIFHKR
jgi:hypothetical protein